MSSTITHCKPICNINDSNEQDDTTNSDEDSLLDVSVGEIEFKYNNSPSPMWLTVDTEFLIQNYSDIIEGCLLDMLCYEDGAEFLIKHVKSFPLIIISKIYLEIKNEIGSLKNHKYASQFVEKLLEIINQVNITDESNLRTSL